MDKSGSSAPLDPIAAPQPATPGEALRWAADNCVPESLYRLRDTLRRWAAEFDAAPAAPGELDLDAIEARANAATPEPWAAFWNSRIGRGVEVTGVGSVRCIQDVAEIPDDRCDWGREEAVEVEPEADAEFIAHARQDVPALAAEVRRLRGEWQVLTDRWGHYKRHYLGALAEAERLRAEMHAVMSLTRDTDGNDLHQDAEIPVSEIWRVVAELDAAPAADPGPDVPPAGTSEALIEALEVLVYERGMDSTDRDPNTCAWLPLMNVVDIIRRWAADPGVYQLPDEPPGPLWDNIARRWDRTSGGWVHTMGKGERRSSLHMTWHDLLDFVMWLSTTPPAGTEGTAVALAIGEDGTAYLDDDTEVPAGEWEPAGTEPPDA